MGSFRRNGGRGDTWYMRIGFVLHFFGVVSVSPTSVGVKYRGGTPLACVLFRVRFAKTGGGGAAGVRELGSFCKKQAIGMRGG